MTNPPMGGGRSNATSVCFCLGNFNLDHDQVEKIKRGNIIPEKKAIDYKMSSEEYFQKITKNMEVHSFKSDEYYNDLKRNIIAWTKMEKN